jgi:anti-sigma B factor antagonist
VQEGFNVQDERRGDELYIRISGELDIATSDCVEQALSKAEGAAVPAIVVDLGHVTFIDASTLGLFLRAADRATQTGRTFAIVHPSDVVKRVLDVTHTTYLLGATPSGVSGGSDPLNIAASP